MNSLVMFFLIGVTGRPNISSEANRDHPDCTILGK